MRGRSRDGKARPLSYANVVSTMALVIAVGGGSALAAGSLAGQAKAKPHKPKLTLNGADKAYISASIAAGHVAFATSAASATNATTATNATHATAADTAKIAGNIYSANVNPDGTMLGSIPAGATSSRTTLGTYSVSFGRPITGCTIGASLGALGVSIGMVGVGVSDANTLLVFTRDSANVVADRGFLIQAICPPS